MRLDTLFFLFERKLLSHVFHQQNIIVNTKFPGGCSAVDTPVPIPNTEVKHCSADGTVWETAWESRSSPGLIFITSLRAKQVLGSAKQFFESLDV